MSVGRCGRLGFEGARWLDLAGVNLLGDHFDAPDSFWPFSSHPLGGHVFWAPFPCAHVALTKRQGPCLGQPVHAAALGPRLPEISSRRLHVESVSADSSRQALPAPSSSILVGYSMNRRSRDDADTSVSPETFTSKTTWLSSDGLARARSGH